MYESLKKSSEAYLLSRGILLYISVFAVAFFIPAGKIHSQVCNSLDIQLEREIPSVCAEIAMTMIHDNLGRPYLYVANKEGGLKIYDLSDPTAPSWAATVPTSAFEGLNVMNLTQEGNYVYLAIGNHFTNPQSGGIAVIDVTDPTAPLLADYYVVPSSASGAGIVKVEGNHAYLGAMRSGLVVLDVTDKSNIAFVSQFVPDINFPVPNPNPNFYNARGMEVRNSIVYLCYDAGGLRIIDCTDKSAPVETGRFSNPALHIPFNLPRAYNNIVLDGSLAYVAVDYCGVEALDVSDPADITLAGWWNPYDCPGNNWFSSPVHANEIAFDENCRLLFVSTGKSDLHVLDVSDPAQPDSCGFYGGASNGVGTWGVGLHQGQIYLSYICTFGIPFFSDWTGVRILSYDAPCTSRSEEPAASGRIFVYPNPASDNLFIRSDAPQLAVQLFYVNGAEVFSGILQNPEVNPIDISFLPTGFYTGLARGKTIDLHFKFIKQY
jgi:hypothetical protein